ncbi:putative adenosine deaminase [Aspergillus saccharolyticus JOP 1030-1]|uniref:Adenosine deaminase n=1 Tax=Aspergillus saccharolyticus JOP 1030-1 TaxID=1450539 RepID=A0A318ZN47_9EURO|nr:adenosine deaminase [Aspergillus saccharolyticus JOP 1030-1]PYH48397.1 adenosine deaminase [Aspergillus saccharolyticus JOP 1030-1]
MDLSKPVDRAFTRALPKVELHAHLSGSISRQCLHEIWQRKKAQEPETFTIEDPLVVMPPGKVDYSLHTFFTTFSTMIYHLLTTLTDIRYATYSTLTDFAADGVTYLELRTIPRASPGHQNFTREEYLITVLETIAEFDRRQRGSPLETQMTTNLILAIDRGGMTAQEAMEVVELAINNRRKCVVVGVDICGNPTKGDISIYGPAIQKAKDAGLGVTLHFAEAQQQPQADELMTLLDFEPDRLGHVIHVPGQVKEKIKKRRLALELCLSCNVHAGMVNGGFAEHHFGEWWGEKDGAVVVLCTDDVGFFCSPVSNEYLLAAEHFHLSRADMLSLCRKSYRVIFGDSREKERLDRLLDDFEANNYKR